MIRRVAVLGLALALVCSAAAFGLSLTYNLTRERIARQIWESQIRAARAVLPGVTSDEGFRELAEEAEVMRREFPLLDTLFAGYDGDDLVGYAIQVRPRGYGGPLTLVVGVGSDGVSTGISVVEHRETPGLGSYIEDESWQAQFRGKTRNDPLTVNRDVDAMSGATISAKGVTRGVREALEAFAAMGGEGTR